MKEKEEGNGISEIFCLLENNLFLAFGIYTLNTFSGFELFLIFFMTVDFSFGFSHGKAKSKIKTSNFL